jgi:hypothetical protein
VFYPYPRALGEVSLLEGNIGKDVWGLLECLREFRGFKGQFLLTGLNKKLTGCVHETCMQFFQISQEYGGNK